MYKAFIFDFDLTLADSSLGILLCFKYTLNKFGYELPSDEEIIKTIGLPLTDALKLLSGCTDDDKNEEMRKCYVSYGDLVMTENTYFYDDTLDILKRIRENGYKSGIVSSKLKFRIEDCFNKKADGFKVDEIIGLNDIKFPKPDPSGLLDMIKRLGFEKENVLYVGDSYIDAMTAQNAGVDFAGVMTGTTNRDEFLKYPYKYLGNNLSEIFDTLL